MTLLVETDTGKVLGSYEGAYFDSCEQFSSDGREFYLNGDPITVIDAESGATLRKIQHSVHSDFIPQSHRLLIYDFRDKHFCVWNADARVKEAEVNADAYGQITFAPNGEYALIGEELYDTSEWRRLRTLPGFDKYLLREFSSDGLTLIGAHQDGNWSAVQTYELKTGKTNFIKLARAPDTVKLSSNGSRMFTIPQQWCDGKVGQDVCLWDTRTGALVARLETSHAKTTEASFSPDGERIVTLNNSGALQTWNATSGEWLCELTCPRERLRPASQPDGIPSFSFSREGNKILLNNGSSFVLWERHRPEQWYGLAWLPEFWLAIGLSLGLLWSFTVRRS
jgi:WD40 repeat protein